MNSNHLLTHINIMRPLYYSYQSVKIFVPTQVLLIINQNSPYTANQINLCYVSTSYTFVFIFLTTCKLLEIQF